MYYPHSAEIRSGHSIQLRPEVNNSGYLGVVLRSEYTALHFFKLVALKRAVGFGSP